MLLINLNQKLVRINNKLQKMKQINKNLKKVLNIH